MDFLFEIGVEELPARYVDSSEAELKKLMTESLKEERRLFYVAITRAKKRLYLLHPEDEKLEERVKKAWYSTPNFEVTATRFLYEIDYKNAEDVNSFLRTSNNYSYETDNILGAMYTQRFRQLNRVTS